MANGIETCIWFDKGSGADAVAFYTDLIPGSRIAQVDTYANSGPDGKEQVIVYEFELAGRCFQAIDAERPEAINPSISLKITSPDRAELERIGSALKSGGFEMMPFGEYDFSPYFGWVADRFGLCWQVMIEPDAPALEVSDLIMFVGNQAGNARAAIENYTTIFPDSSIDLIADYVEGDPDKPGFVKYSRFHLAGESFSAMDSGLEHQFGFNDSMSLVVMCDSQNDVDHYWDALVDGGQPVQCGWLKDRYGVSWQIIPRRLNELLRGDDPAAVDRTMSTMLQQIKLDVSKLESAYQGVS